jgi:hypothetical protein
VVQCWTVVKTIMKKITVFWDVMPCSLVSTLKMEAACSTEMSIRMYQTTQRHIKEDGTFQSYRCKNVSHRLMNLPAYKNQGLWLFQLQSARQRGLCSVELVNLARVTFCVSPAFTVKVKLPLCLIY